MDDQTAFVLALQLIALCTVVSALILYLMCKIPKNYFSSVDNDGNINYQNIGGGRAILITSIDNFLGLQLAYHLFTRGFRVFAGVKPSGFEAEHPKDGNQNHCLVRKILEAKCKHFEAFCKKEESENFSSSLVIFPLEVTREDLLHEAVGFIRRYLPAGEDGLWAVINTAGLPCRNRLDGQDSTYWDAIMKLNVTGALKVSKTFMPLLRNKKGRLINLGAKMKNNKGCDDAQSLVAHTASRYAVEGASAALRNEMKHLGIKVVTLHPEGLPIPILFLTPNKSNVTQVDKYVDCDISVLPVTSLKIVEKALLSDTPKASYSLMKGTRLFRIKEKMVNFTNSIQIV